MAAPAGRGRQGAGRGVILYPDCQRLFGAAIERIRRARGSVQRGFAPVIVVLGIVFTAELAHADTGVLVDVNGSHYRDGMRIESGTHISLKWAEEVTVIYRNGNLVTLDGPYEGPLPDRQTQGSASHRSLLGAFLDAIGNMGKAQPASGGANR
jgi:hypothetical protein